jgi:hypothetical protein
VAKKRKATRKQLAALRRGRMKAARGRYKVKRTGLRRYRKKGQKRKIKVLTVSNRARRVGAKRKSGGRKSPKRAAAGRKAARTRKRNKAARAAAGRKGARKTARRSRKRNPIPNPVKHKSAKRKSPKRVAAAKKAARTRKRNAAAKATPAARRTRKRISVRVGKKRYVCKPRRRRARSGAPEEQTGDYRHDVPEGYSRSRKKKRKSRRGRDAKGHFLPKRRKGRRKNPLPNPVRRRRGRRSNYSDGRLARRTRSGKIRHYYPRKRNPFPNPIPNPMSGPMEFISAVFGVGFGYVLASALDRYAAGHALTTVNGTLMDAPAAGQIYDSEAPMLPIWQNWQRLAFAGGAVAAPLVLAGVVSGGARQALALVALGALVRTAGKALEDGIATAGTTQPLIQQLYAPEIAAANRLATAGTATALPQAAPNTFAGLPRGYRGIAAAPARQLGMGDAGDCGCPPTSMITDPVADRNAFMQGMDQPMNDPYSAAGCGGCGQCSSCQQQPPPPPQTSTFNPLSPMPPTPIVAPPTPVIAPPAQPPAGPPGIPPMSSTFPMPMTLPPITQTPAGGYLIPPIQQQPPAPPAQPSTPPIPNPSIPSLTTVFPNGPTVYTPR